MSNIPQSLRLMNASEVSNVVTGRQTVTIYPTGGQEYPVTSGGNVIEFKLPVAAAQSVDMSTFYVHGNFQIKRASGVTDTLVYPEDSLESIIDEVVVFVGSSGQELERIGRGYYRVESALNAYINSNYKQAAGSSMFYSGLSREERIRLFSNTGNATGHKVQFSMPLRLVGVSSPDVSILPSYMFGQSSFLTIRIRLAEPAACLLAYTESDVTATAGANGAVALVGGARTAGTATYELTNVRASFDMVQTSQEYQNQISQFLASQSLVYNIRTWDIDFRSIPAGIASKVENLSYNYRDVESLYFMFQRDSELNSFAHHGEDRFWFPNNLQSIQLTVNGQRVPSVPIDLTNGASEALSHTITALGSLHAAELAGPFAFDRIQSKRVAYGQTGGVIYSSEISESGNVYYGRNKTGEDQNIVVGSVSIAGAAGQSPPASTLLNVYANDKTPSYFLIGLNMRKLLDLPPGELSGLNLQNTSGSISYELKFSPNSTESYQMGVAVLHNRFVSLSGAGVSVDV